MEVVLLVVVPGIAAVFLFGLSLDFFINGFLDMAQTISVRGRGFGAPGKGEKEQDYGYPFNIVSYNEALLMM